MLSTAAGARPRARSRLGRSDHPLELLDEYAPLRPERLGIVFGQEASLDLAEDERRLDLLDKHRHQGASEIERLKRRIKIVRRFERRRRRRAPAR